MEEKIQKLETLINEQLESVRKDVNEHTVSLKKFENQIKDMEKQ